MNALSNRLRSERGSLPMVLLASIIVAGLSSVLVARVIGEMRAVSFDEEYTVAAHVADAGVHEALFLLNNKLITQTSTCSTDSPAVPGRACGEGVLDGEPYRWVAEYEPTEQEWAVTSSGTVNDRDDFRTLDAVIAEEPLFNVAAFSEQGMTFNGGNSADSYNSVLGTKCSLDGPPNHECLGIISSNDDMRLKGSNEIDQVHVYDWDARPDGGGVLRCDGEGNSEVFCNPPHRRNIGPPYKIDPAIIDVQDEIDDTCTTWHSWTASSEGNGTVTFPFDGGTHCFDNLVFDRDTVLRSSVTPTNPLRILMRGTGKIQVDGHRKVNLENCSGGGTDMPCSVRMVVRTLGTDDGATEAVRIENHAGIAMGLYAPLGSCGILSGSNAQAEIYGSMICMDIRNQGGWAFHYDEALAGAMTNGVFTMSRMDER